MVSIPQRILLLTPEYITAIYGHVMVKNILVVIFAFSIPVVSVFFLAVCVYILVNVRRFFKYKDEIISKARAKGVAMYSNDIIPVSSRKEIRAFLLNWCSENCESDEKDRRKLSRFYLNHYRKLPAYIISIIIYIIIGFILILTAKTFGTR